MSFDKLLEDLDALQTLQKSEAATADDKKIAAAADEALEGEPPGVPPDDDDEEMVAEDDTDAMRAQAGESMGKSFRVQLESGEEIDAVDGTALVKSLMERVDQQETTAQDQAQTLAKALGVAVDLLTEQGKSIALLKSEVARLGSEGRGRKAVVSVNDKPADMHKPPAQEGVSSEEFMSKALIAQAAGRITGLQVSIAEGSLLKGMAVPAEIINKVLV